MLVMPDCIIECLLTGLQEDDRRGYGYYLPDNRQNHQDHFFLLLLKDKGHLSVASGKYNPNLIIDYQAGFLPYLSPSGWQDSHQT